MKSEQRDVNGHKPARREVLKGAAGAATAWMTAARGSAQDAHSARPAVGDLLVKVGDDAATPLLVSDILSDTATLAWPLEPDNRVVRNGSRLNRIVLVRVDPAGLTDRTRAQAADGIVAYSAVCTHTGCEVGAFLGDELALYCDCHQSKFDVRDRARVVDGPAPRPLPALPLRIVDGRLVVAGPFTARPGAEQG